MGSSLGTRGAEFIRLEGIFSRASEVKPAVVGLTLIDLLSELLRSARSADAYLEFVETLTDVARDFPDAEDDPEGVYALVRSFLDKISSGEQAEQVRDKVMDWFAENTIQPS